MSSVPKVFVSATSGDLRSIRRIINDALLTINCHPVEQTNFEPDARTVEGMLEAKISGCQALIHIVGKRYGAEPDPGTLPSDGQRRSYTQMEYDIGRKFQSERGDANFRVYTFICPDDFPYDPEPDEEDEEKRNLQAAYRKRILADPHLRESPRDGDDVRSRILALQERVLGLQGEMSGIHKQGQKFSKVVLGGVAALIALTIGGLWLQSKTGDDVKQAFDELKPKPAPVKKGTLRLVAIMGENVEYEKAILRGFREEMTKLAEERGYEVFMPEAEDPHFAPGKYASPREPDAKAVWEGVIARTQARYPEVDYYVTLGTYATQAIKASGLLDRPGTKGLIYLGVTDPADAKIHGTPKIAGVQYGPGPTEYGKTLDKLFKPEQRLVFLYNEGVPQDDAVRRALLALNEELAAEANPTRRNPRFEMSEKPHSKLIGIDDIIRPDKADPLNSPVYFAWYGLDNILSMSQNFRVIEREQLWVVPSTYSRENLNFAGVVVSVKDEMVGALGASIIADKIDHPNSALNRMPIKQPPFMVWVNGSTIAKNGLDETIRMELLENSSVSENSSWITFEE